MFQRGKRVCALDGLTLRRPRTTGTLGGRRTIERATLEYTSCVIGCKRRTSRICRPTADVTSRSLLLDTAGVGGRPRLAARGTTAQRLDLYRRRVNCLRRPGERGSRSVRNSAHVSSPTGNSQLSRMRTKSNTRPVDATPGHDCSETLSISLYQYDPQTGVALGSSPGPQCAFEMSMLMCPAVHTTTRSLLRLSSTHEPSDPPLRVVTNVCMCVAVSKYVYSESRAKRRGSSTEIERRGPHRPAPSELFLCGGFASRLPKANSPFDGGPSLDGIAAWQLLSRTSVHGTPQFLFELKERERDIGARPSAADSLILFSFICH